MGQPTLSTHDLRMLQRPKFHTATGLLILLLPDSCRWSPPFKELSVSSAQAFAWLGHVGMCQNLAYFCGFQVAKDIDVDGTPVMPNQAGFGQFSELPEHLSQSKPYFQMFSGGIYWLIAWVAMTWLLLSSFFGRHAEEATQNDHNEPARHIFFL